MTKVVYIIAHQDFRDEEYFEPKKILEENGIKVVTASSSLDPAKGSLGGVANVDITIDQILPIDFDAIILAGGSGARQYIKDPKIEKVLIDFKNSEKIIAAICIAPVILAKTGLLDNKNFTVHAHGIDLVSPLKSDNLPVVVDGKIITANGPSAAQEFGQTIVNKLKHH